MDVVSDRYTLSSLAYQGLTTGDMAWVDGRSTAGRRRPDLTVFLRVRAGGGASAAGGPPPLDREIFEVGAFQRRVARSYDRAMAHLRAAGSASWRWTARRRVEAVAAAVLAEVERIR